jgi:esterase
MSEAIELSYTRQGEGPPLLILHGLYGAGSNWASHAKWLAEHYSVILPDLRNHGGSPHHPDMSYPAMASDLLALLDRLQLPSAIVLGHSMGGKAAMTLALTAPERAQALIVADIAPVSYRQHGHAGIIAALRGLDLAQVSSRSEADAALRGEISSPMVRQFLLTNLRRDPGGYRWRLPLDVLADQLPLIEGFPELAGRYSGPTLFVHGADSDYVSADARPAIERYFPNAELTAVAGAGHWLHVEQPEPFAQALRGFLQRL